MFAISTLFSSILAAQFEVSRTCISMSWREPARFLTPVLRWLVAATAHLLPDLLGYWNFEDGPGSPTASDASGNGHTGRINGGRHDGTKWPQSGLAGGSYAQDFQGSADDTIIVDHLAGFPTGNSPRTTMLWMRSCGGDGQHGLLTFGCGGTRQMWDWQIRNQGGSCDRLYMDIHGDCEWGNGVGTCSDYADVPSAEMTSETWQHVAITYDGTTLVGYRNGVEIARNDPDVSLNTCPIDDTTTGEYGSFGYIFNMGSNYVMNENYYGQMDEVAVYGIALTASDIAAVYNDGAGLDLMGPPPSPPQPGQYNGGSCNYVPSGTTSVPCNGSHPNDRRLCCCVGPGDDPSIACPQMPSVSDCTPTAATEAFPMYNFSAVTETSLLFSTSAFSVSGVGCSSGHVGTAVAGLCRAQGTPYSVVGCSPAACVRPDASSSVGCDLSAVVEMSLFTAGLDVTNVLCARGHHNDPPLPVVHLGGEVLWRLAIGPVVCMPSLHLPHCLPPFSLGLVVNVRASAVWTLAFPTAFHHWHSSVFSSRSSSHSSLRMVFCSGYRIQTPRAPARLLELRGRPRQPDGK